jgi:hypothetical protein
MVDGVRQDIEGTAPQAPGGTGAGTLETSTPSVTVQQFVKGRKKFVLLVPHTALALCGFQVLFHPLPSCSSAR